MSPFSMALMSGRRRQSVGASSLCMLGSISFKVMANAVKLYIYPTEKHQCLNWEGCITDTKKHIVIVEGQVRDEWVIVVCGCVVPGLTEQAVGSFSITRHFLVSQSPSPEPPACHLHHHLPHFAPTHPKVYITMHDHKIHWATYIHTKSHHILNTPFSMTNASHYGGYWHY